MIDVTLFIKEKSQLLEACTHFTVIPILMEGKSIQHNDNCSEHWVYTFLFDYMLNSII